MKFLPVSNLKILIVILIFQHSNGLTKVEPIKQYSQVFYCGNDTTLSSLVSETTTSTKTTLTLIETTSKTFQNGLILTRSLLQNLFTENVLKSTDTLQVNNTSIIGIESGAFKDLSNIKSLSIIYNSLLSLDTADSNIFEGLIGKFCFYRKYLSNTLF